MAAIVSLANLTVETPPENFLAAAGGAAWTAAPAERLSLRSYSRLDAPGFAADSRKAYFAALGYDAPALKLYRLQNVRFAGTSAAFWIGEDLVAESVAHWRPGPLPDPAELRAELIRRIGRKPLKLHIPARRLDGVWLLGASLYGGNHYHWHMDLLPAAALLAELRALAGVKVLVEERTPFVVESLTCLGVAGDDIHVLPSDAPVLVDQLVFASSFITAGAQLHPRALDSYRAVKARLDLAPVAAPGRRLFASRGASERRRPANREQVEAAFAAAGFEVIDPGALAYREQARLFHEADVVVGEHGANLSNCGFCRPGTLVAELLHPVRSQLCYLSLAEGLDLLHRSILGVEDAQGWRLDPDAAVGRVLDAMARREEHLDRMRALDRVRRKTGSV